MFMKIIKKDRTIEKFEIHKVETSMLNAAYDINMSLTPSDLNIMLNYITKLVKSLHKETNTTNVYEMRSLINKTLIDFGFSEIAKSYMNDVY